MALAVSVNSLVAADPGAGEDSTQRSVIVEGPVVASGNYGTASSHGDTMSFALPQVYSDLIPKRVRVYEVPASGTAPAGKYLFTFCPGTTQANGVLFIWDTSADAEISEGGAYPAALTGAVLRFEAWFAKNV